jgi:glucose-6-phosphate dehydrogenase assembly protein OpcA
MAAALSEFAGARVALGELPRALAQLWRQVEASAQGVPLSRTLTMNFIGVADAAGEALLREAVERLLVRHPCRAFLIVLDETAEPTATLAARTLDGKSDRQTVLEQILLQTRARELARLPGVILPLLVNDIPTHLYWALPLPDSLAQLTMLARVADQLVVNSALFDDPSADRARLEETGLEPVDLVQFRLRPWRRALAEAFEHFEWNSDTETRVRIEHAPCAAARAAALRLGAWLDERLGARCEPVALGASSEPAPTDPCRLDLHHGDVTVVIENARARARLCVQVTRADVCLLPFEVPASRGRDGDLLAAAIDLV